MSSASLLLQAELWLHQGEWDAIAAFLAGQPLAEAADSPVLFRLRGHLLWHQHAWADGFVALERACQLAVQRNEWSLAVDCALDLARWRQSKEDMVAARFELERARRFAETAERAEPAVEAKLALAIGRLAPDLEQAELGAQWCTRALTLFEKLGDVVGQVDALWNLAVCNTYAGRLLEASSQAQRALQLHTISESEPLRHLYLLNLIACLALYRGDTKAGLKTIEEARPLAARHPHSKPTLYLADTEAGLWRQKGDLLAAIAAHGRVEEILLASNDEGYRPWLVMDRGWTRVLLGETPAAVRRDLLQAGDLQDRNMRRYLNLYLGLLEILEGRLTDALARLTTLRQQFVSGGELLFVFAVDLYLAYVCLASRQEARCHEALERGLGWGEVAAVDGFALWWHPRILAQVCIEALAAAIHPRQAEVMIVRRLGDAAVPGLLALAGAAQPDIRQRARSVLLIVDQDAAIAALDEQAEPQVRAAVMDHLARGRLTLTGLARLRLRLDAGWRSATWQRIAVFGFYVKSDLGREAVGERLGLSEGAVKKHIAAIRAAYGINSSGGRDAGRQAVAQQAQVEGFTPIQGL